MRLCLDSDVLIDILRGDKRAERVAERIKSGEIEGFVSAVSAFELYFGAFRANDPAKALEAVGVLLRSLTTLPLEDRAAYIAGKAAATLGDRGEPLEMRDVLIAACACAAGLPLATWNRKHFSRIPGITLHEL